MTKRILIVDDEPNVRLGYRITLETEGYEVCEANGAAEALNAFAAGRFDLTILDLRMPEMDGLDLLAEIRNAHISVPVVIITAYGDVPNAVRAMKLGAIDFLQKPLTPEMLRLVVTEVFQRHAPEPSAKERKQDAFYTHVFAAKRLINLQDFVGAKAHLIHALEINPQSAEVLNLTGVFLEMREEYENAKKHYGRAIAIDKNYEPAQQNMRRIFELFNFGSSKEPFNLGIRRSK